MQLMPVFLWTRLCSATKMVHFSLSFCANRSHSHSSEYMKPTTTPFATASWGAYAMPVDRMLASWGETSLEKAGHLSSYWYWHWYQGKVHVLCWDQVGQSVVVRARFSRRGRQDLQCNERITCARQMFAHESLCSAPGVGGIGDT